MRKLHEWVGIGVGVLFAVWVVSGLVMVLPFGSRAAYDGPYGPADFSLATVSPAEASRVALADQDDAAQVRAFRLRRLEDRFVYVLEIEGGEPRMVDAETGQVVTVTSAMAERLARAEFGAAADVTEVRLMEQRDLSYAYGPMPAWRVAFDDPRSSVSYVALADASIRRADRITRMRGLIAGTHSFDVLESVKLADLQVPLLLLASFVSMVTVVTGYYLTLSRTALRRTARKGDHRASDDDPESEL